MPISPHIPLRTLPAAFVLALVLLVLPPGGAAQVEASPPSDDRLQSFARAYVQIAEIRDQLQQDLARFHELDGRTRARSEADRKIAAALAAQDLSLGEYEAFISQVSLDPDLSESFQAAIRRARESGE
jgi:hypothetical protein